MRHHGMIFAALFLCMSSSVNAEGIPATDLRFSGFGAVTFGQVVKGVQNNAPVEKAWQERLFVQLNAHAKVRERIEIVLGLEGMLSFSYPQLKLMFDTQAPRFIMYPHHVEGSYKLGPLDNPYLRIGAGYFPFKYNNECTNLGEYLLRSGVYPNYIINDFDFAMTRLLGVRLSSDLLDMIHQDLLLTSETEVFPTQDWSLSYLLSVQPHKFVDVGCGVSFSRLISVDPHATTPRDAQNAYAIDYDTLPDLTLDNDSSFYTFKGTKLMGRLTLDPKAFIPLDIFGKEDLKFYVEVAVLGVKDYPAKLNDSLIAYNDITERMPVMVGFHIPTFKVLDVLAVEAEYYPNPYLNNRTSQLTENLPQPYPGEIDTTSKGNLMWTGDWKWSVYAKRTIVDHFAVIGQIARDHSRPLDHRGDLRKVGFSDVLRTWEDWAWMLKVQFAF